MRSHANRVPQAPNRKKITPEGGASYYATVENADNPVAEGAIVNKAMLDEFLAASGTTAGSGASFTLAQDGFSLFDGALVRVKLNRDMVAGATLNVNGTGAKAIVDSKGRAIRAGAKSGAWLSLVYNGTSYVLQYGDSEQSTGKTVVFVKSGTFNPAAFGLMAGDAINITCVGGGQGGSAWEYNSGYARPGGNGAASSFGSYLTAAGADAENGLYKGGPTPGNYEDGGGHGAGGYIPGLPNWGGDGGSGIGTAGGPGGANNSGNNNGTCYGGGKGALCGGGSGYGAGGGGYSAGYKYAYYGGNSGYVKTSVVVLTSANTIPISVGGGGSGSVRGKNGIAGTTSGGGARVNGENTGIGGAGGYNNIPGEGGASGGGAGGYVVISW